MAIKRTRLKEFQPGRGYTKEDWDAVDSPPLTDDELARMRPAREVLPPDVFRAIEDVVHKARGRPKLDKAKVAVTLRLDPQTLETFKAAGDDWRRAMAEELRKAAAKIDPAAAPAKAAE